MLSLGSVVAAEVSTELLLHPAASAREAGAVAVAVATTDGGDSLNGTAPTDSTEGRDTVGELEELFGTGAAVFDGDGNSSS